MTDLKRVSNLIAAPVFGTFVIYILFGRSYVVSAAGATVALIFEAILVLLVLFVGVTDLYVFWQQRKDKSE